MAGSPVVDSCSFVEEVALVVVVFPDEFSSEEFSSDVLEDSSDDSSEELPFLKPVISISSPSQQLLLSSSVQRFDDLGMALAVAKKASATSRRVYLMLNV